METARIIAPADGKSRCFWEPGEQVEQRLREIRLLCRNAVDDAELRADFAGVVEKLGAVGRIAEEALELHAKSAKNRSPLTLPSPARGEGMDSRFHGNDEGCVGSRIAVPSGRVEEIPPNPPLQRGGQRKGVR